MEIAPHHPERQRVGAGIDVEERLLLDRIALHAGDVAKRDAQLAVLVEAHAANPAAPGGDEAAVAAGDAANPVAFGPPQRTDGRVTAEHIGQRFAAARGFAGAAGEAESVFGPGFGVTFCIQGTADRLKAMLRRAGGLSKPGNGRARPAGARSVPSRSNHDFAAPPECSQTQPLAECAAAGDSRAPARRVKAAHSALRFFVDLAAAAANMRALILHLI